MPQYQKQFDGMSRDALEARAAELARERDAYLSNLTNVQARCTELLLENRELRARWPGWECPARKVWNSDAKEHLRACRCCGIERPA